MRFCAALAAAVAAFAQQPPAVQVSPAVLEFNDADIGFSRSITLTSGNASVALDVVADGGNLNLPAPAWLAVTPRLVATPGRVTVSVTRPAGTGTFVGRVAIRRRAAATGAVPVEVIAVLVTVRLTRPSEAFSVSPASLAFESQVGGNPDPQTLLIRGANCGSVRATASIPWLTVAPDRAGAACQNLVVTVRTGGLAVGGRSGTIRIESDAGRADVAVTLFLIAPGPLLGISPQGLQFESRRDQGSSITRNVSVLSEGSGGFEWTARVIDPPGPEAAWVGLGASAGSTALASDGRIPVSVDPSGLEEGTYYALVEVSAPGARNSPRLFPIAYRVLAPAAPASATPSPSGMLFPLPVNSARSAAQALTVFTSSVPAVPFLATAHTFEGGDRLTLEFVNRTTSTAAPARVNVFATPGRLAPGTYRGEVNVYIQAQGSTDVRSVNVTMIVTPAPSAPRTAARPPGLEGCTTTSLTPTHTGLVNNFQTLVAWPTPLNVRLLDNCGELVPDARVLVQFSNGDPPLALASLENGNYSGTWVPRNLTGGITIRAIASRGAITSEVELLGRIIPSGAPLVAPNGVVNNFDRRAGGPLAPATLVEIFGNNLAGPLVTAPPGPLPSTLGGVTVFVGSARMPIFAVSTGQINAQLPAGLPVDQRIPVVVKANDSLSVPVDIGIVPVQPGVAAFADGRAIAQDLQFRLISADNKARRGGFVFLYLVGMGAVSPAVAAGASSPASPLAQVTVAPEVTLGGRPVRVQFAGLTPGLAGLYQINAILPDEIPPGDWPLIVRQGGVESAPVTIPVE